MPSIFSSNFLNRYPIERAMREFGRQFDSQSRILDIGCGYKPYAKYFQGKYIGVDHDRKHSNADIISDSAHVPLAAESIDAIILNQTLEHTEDLAGTIAEIKRLLKPNGLVFISVPLVMKIHSIPLPSENSPHHNFDQQKIKTWNIDFWRFTKFGLISLFREWQIVQLEETSGYAGTIGQLINYFLASFGLPYVFIPIYLINNVMGGGLDRLLHGLSLVVKKGLVLKFYNLIYMSLPLNYILIIRKK